MWSQHLEKHQLMFQPKPVEVKQEDLELEGQYRELWNQERPQANEIQKLANGYFN